ncbi:TVP38/TMEM64 family protein [Blastococcus saxobsidens]|uniref:TVP38/TMEM64 family membrane protein n=1 Tax=Blastococcus saxobsidens TaxID=138336 RepID=A0A6L9VYA7_9ACTN|nr:TVP38/TMEM64 family protein [Blastococcus saxobsidens]
MRTGQGIWLRTGVLGALIVAGGIAALVLDLPDPGQLRAWLDGGGPTAWVLLVGGLALVLLAPVPRSVLAVLSGLVLGFTAGLIVSVIGGLLAGLVAFGLSRALGRPTVERLAGPRLHRVDQLFTERGFISVLAVRMIPVMPHVVVSYGAGLSGIRLGPYFAATAVGLVPSTVVQVGVGASTGFVVEQHLTTLTVVPALVIGLALLAAGVWWYRRRARRATAGEPGRV